MTPPIIVVGDAMLDVTCRVQSPIAVETDTRAVNSVHCGGAAANIAVGLAHLGAKVTFLGSVGNDPAGDLIIREFANHGVTAHVQRNSEKPTGSCVVLVDRSGERSMLSDSGANQDLRIDPDAFIGFGHIHISGYVLQYPQSVADLHTALARRQEATVSIDIASTSLIHAHGERIAAIVRQADVTFGTDAEFAALATTHPTSSIWVVKSGPDGVHVRGCDPPRHCPAPQVSVTSTTGAGDAFGAGFLTGWLADHDIDRALALAQTQAAAALTRVGAWPVQARTAR
jgi:sugar/nucleoside kinase (ribokinase family)